MNLNNLKAALDGESVDISNEISTLNEVLQKSFGIEKIDYKSKTSMIVQDQLDGKIKQAGDTVISDEMLKTYKRDDQLLQILSQMITFAEQIDETVIDLNKLKIKIDNDYQSEYLKLDKQYQDVFNSIKLKYCNFGL